MIPDPLGALVAHGIGGRTDLPLSAWMFGSSGATALLVWFAALETFWPQPRFEPRPGAVAARYGVAPGEDAGRGRVATVLGAVGVLGLLVVLGAAAFGDDLVTRNLAPVAVYVLFWVGLTVVCALVVDVWNAGLDPFIPLGDAVAGPEAQAFTLGHWPAAAGLLAFVWIELVHPDRAEPRVLAVLIVAYTAVVLAGTVRWGRPWVREGETFAVWFGLLGHMAPIGSRPDGRFGPRIPLAGLARLAPRRGTIAVVVVALGSTVFDGLTGTSWWGDLVGGRTPWGAVPIATLGLLLAIGAVAALYLGAMRMTSAMTGRPTGELADTFVHSLVPIAFAYAVAHDFSLLIIEGQAALASVSDPFNLGWDLFGTADWAIDYTLVSPNTVAYVQLASILAGHLAGVVLAHDRALARFPKTLATRSQYPLLVTMVASAVGGLGLLLGP